MNVEQLKEIERKALERGSTDWDAQWLLVALACEIAERLREIDSSLNAISGSLPFAGKGN